MEPKKAKELHEKVKILGARVLVKEIRDDSETKSGIILPGQEKQKTNRGVVLQVGDGAILENGQVVPMKVAVGDFVLYSSFSGSPIKEKPDDNDIYLILNERDILCIYKDDEE